MSVIDPSQLPYRPGVGIMLFNAQGQVFVGRRIDTKQEAWQMPQGGIDPGEEPLTAVLRELEEETGITKARILAETQDWLTYELPPHLLGTAWRGKYRGQRQKWFAALYLGSDHEIDVQTAHPEFNAWAWMDIDGLAAQAVPFKRALYDAVVEQFRPLAHELAAGRPV
jgi:putative (di)nucleoside polyphosphate hydrolase